LVGILQLNELGKDSAKQQGRKKMQYVYVIDGYIFRREGDESSCYFTIIHPDGRYLDRNHYFSSENEMREWIRNRDY